MTNISIIRSNPVSEMVVRACIETCRNSFGDNDFEMSDCGPSGGVLLVERLFDLRAFGKVYSVTVKYSAKVDEYTRTAAIRDVFDSNPAVFRRERWEASPSDPHTRELHGISQDPSMTMTFGSSRRDGEYYAYFDTCFPPPLDLGKQCRKELLERAIDSAGYMNRISVQLDVNGELRITAKQLKITNIGAEPSGANPSGFAIYTFQSSQAAADAWQAMARGVGAQITRGIVAADLPAPWYDETFPQLNELARGWDIQIISEMDGPAALPLDEHGLIERGPGHYPLFRWFDRDYNVAILGTAVVEDGESRLELACEDGSTDALMDRASILKGVEFETVLP